MSTLFLKIILINVHNLKNVFNSIYKPENPQAFLGNFNTFVVEIYLLCIEEEIFVFSI